MEIRQTDRNTAAYVDVTDGETTARLDGASDAGRDSDNHTCGNFG